MHQLNRLISFSLLVLCVGLSSCSSSGSSVPLEKVTGKVTLNGEALDGAIIIFEEVNTGASSHGLTDAEGQYELKSKQDESGAPAGKYVVKIIKPEGEVAGQELIPAKYNSKSELKAEVKTGENKYDFDLMNQ
ncbi:carboxypeptidase-like regulatory domain-containing protein [uncultured Gimesia sp.]|uniref:carboxypeptidase-like regulatory domain-containing protein n=1 Tax=uncultured Gimesia sp. TaxID=1678688 RepID=UPI0030D7BF75|tara:strand:- start:101706 stop:102104 length:399 start_codon:yes stop_codon:yes gene_type:complete